MQFFKDLPQAKRELLLKQIKVPRYTSRMFFFLKFLSYTYFEFSLEVMYRSTSKAA